MLSRVDFAPFARCGLSEQLAGDSGSVCGRTGGHVPGRIAYGDPRVKRSTRELSGLMKVSHGRIVTVLRGAANSHHPTGDQTKTSKKPASFRRYLVEHKLPRKSNNAEEALFYGTV